MISNRLSFPKLSIHDSDTLCQYYLNIIYHNTNGPRAGENYKINNIAITYGEILYPSIDKLLSAISLTEQDVFVDLGSGLGKFVLQVFLKTAVKEARGIELVPDLHQQALAATQRVQQDLPDFYAEGRKLTFLLGSFLEIPLTQATAVLISSPCFSPKILDTLGKIIDSTPSIHSVLTFRPISTLQRLSFKKSIRIECSWDSALCYLYHNE